MICINNNSNIDNEKLIYYIDWKNNIENKKALNNEENLKDKK